MCEFSQSLQDVNHTASLTLSDDRIQRFKYALADDPVLQVLWETIRHAKKWPESKSDVPKSVHTYYDFCDELIVQSQLVFKGDCLVVPATLSKEMMAAVHASHIDIGGYIRKAQDSMHWTHSTTELRAYISKCDICLILTGPCHVRSHSCSISLSDDPATGSVQTCVSCQGTHWW